MHAYFYHSTKETEPDQLGKSEQDNSSAARQTFRKKLNEATREVHVLSRLRASDYAAVGSSKDVGILKAYAQALIGKKIIFINATYEGGGVAIMRAPLIGLLRSLGVDAHWYVLKPDEKAFLVTKRKFHNVLQNVAGPGVELTDEDKAIYEDWIKDNVKALSTPISTADVIVIDDWQPSGLIPYVKGLGSTAGLNPNAKLIFRDHIQTEGKLMGTPGTAQYKTWQYIWNHNQVSKSDVFVVHPKDDFVPPDVPNQKVVFVPAASDLLDDLNRSLSEDEYGDGMAFINHQLAQNDNQTPIDAGRPYIALIARFDPSKGMPNALSIYASVRDKMIASKLPMASIPQLVIVGNGSADDPDGIPVLNQVMKLRAGKYADIKDDIKVARVPHNDRAINALVHNSKLVIQPSLEEGFESRVTDAILQGKPVIGSNRGGIPLQIVDGHSGYVIDPEDVAKWANCIVEIMTKPAHYEYLVEQVRRLAKSHNYEFTTIPNALNWLHLSAALLTQPSFNGNRQWVRDMRAKSVQDVEQYAPHVPQPSGVHTWQPAR